MIPPFKYDDSVPPIWETLSKIGENAPIGAFPDSPNAVNISVSVDSEIFKELQKQADEEGAQIDVLQAKNNSLLALAKLGKWVLDMRSEHDCDTHELDIEGKALELGLFVEVMATESCGEGCYCNSWSTFPQQCLRLTDKAKVLEK